MKDISNLDVLADDIRVKLCIDTDPIPDGQFHRYPAPGKSSSNTACWLKVSEDGLRANFGNFITGCSFTWQSGQINDLSVLPLADCDQDYIEHSIQQRAEAQAKAADKAQALLKLADPATASHPYISQKKIVPDNLFTNGSELLIPMRDINGELRSLQRIYPDGSKLFLKGGMTKGVFAVCGTLFATKKLYVCEGYATAATVHELTGHTAVAAMNAGNLLEVCLTLDAHKPDSTEIIVAVDNDHRTEGNPGIKKGQQAALAIGAEFTYPQFPCDKSFCKCTDFNDLEHCTMRDKGAAHD